MEKEIVAQRSSLESTEYDPGPGISPEERKNLRLRQISGKVDVGVPGEGDPDFQNYRPRLPPKEKAPAMIDRRPRGPGDTDDDLNDLDEELIDEADLIPPDMDEKITAEDLGKSEISIGEGQSKEDHFLSVIDVGIDELAVTLTKRVMPAVTELKKSKSREIVSAALAMEQQINGVLLPEIDKLITIHTGAVDSIDGDAEESE